MMKNEEKVHILVVSQYFYPEQFRINDICTEWVKRGYKVTVLTGIPNYPQGKFYDGYGIFKKRSEVWNGIEIIRIPIIPRGHNSLGLCINYLSFVVSGFFWKCFTKVNADIVFNYETSPMTQALVGAWFAKRRKVPFYLYVTDLWPDNVEIITGIHNKFIISALNSMVNYIYKKCTKIFTSSKSFIAKMTERGVPSQKLEFWPQYAEEFYRPCSKSEAADIKNEIPDDGIFNIVFAGNIGYAQGLGVLAETASILKKENFYIRFNIIGDGRYKNKMLEEIENKNISEYFNFFEKQPAKKIPLYMAYADAALICLSKSEVFAMTIPAKTQSCMACGVPILVSADGEVREIIEEAGCGFTSASSDAKRLAENIKKICDLSEAELDEMRRNSRSYYDRNYNKCMLMDKMDAYITEELKNVDI